MRVLFVVFIYFISWHSTWAAKKLIFSGIEGSVNTRISFLVIQEAYNQLGIDIEYKPLPGERSLQTSNSGEVDGEVFRIKNVHKRYKNLVPVPTPINVLEGVAFSRNPNIQISGWDSLRQFKVGIQVGIKFVERGTKGMKCTRVTTNEQLFKMLAANRVEVVVVALANGLETLQKLQLNEIQAVQPSIQIFPLYHYVHKKNKALVPRLNKVLQEMQKTGRVQQIRALELQKLLTTKR